LSFETAFENVTPSGIGCSYGSFLLIGDWRLVVAKGIIDFIQDCFSPKEEPLSNL